MPDATQESCRTLDVGLEDLRSARANLTERRKEDELAAAAFRSAIGVMRRFYRAFFQEVYDTDVEGFGWEEKRDAVNAILAKQDAEREDEDLTRTRLDVATLFEDLADVLHGDVDFGYTDDIELLRDFTREYLDIWAEAVFRWLEAAGAPRAKDLKARYASAGTE